MMHIGSLLDPAVIRVVLSICSFPKMQGKRKNPNEAYNTRDNFEVSKPCRAVQCKAALTAFSDKMLGRL